MCVVTIKKSGHLPVSKKLNVSATRISFTGEQAEKAVGQKGLPPKRPVNSTVTALPQNTSHVMVSSVRWAGSRPGK